MTTTATVLNVIGTGDPMDMIFMIPLVHEWRASRACATEQQEPCEKPIQRIVILAEPGIIDDHGIAHATLAYCESHFQTFVHRSDEADR
jgi:hypothetical protein